MPRIRNGDEFRIGDAGGELFAVFIGHDIVGGAVNDQRGYGDVLQGFCEIVTKKCLGVTNHTGLVATEIFVTRFRKGVHVRVPSCFDLFLRLRRSALRHGCWRWIA